jgi:hypothetical protein
MEPRAVGLWGVCGFGAASSLPDRAYSKVEQARHRQHHISFNIASFTRRR